MKINYKSFIKGICFIFFIISYKGKAQSQTFNYNLFLQGAIGGGSVTASLSNNVFSLSFNAGFTETYMKQGAVAELSNFTAPLTNSEIPIPAGNFFSDKGYKFYLVNNKICIYSLAPQPLTSFPAGTILSINLATPINVSNEMADYFNKKKNRIVSTEYLTDQGQNGNKRTSITYFDGLGREMENIMVAYTPSGKDLVSFSKYDDFGRLNKEYLPVPSSQSYGLFMPESGVSGSAASNYNGEVPYSEKIFDDSPLNRVIKQAAPGNAWQKNSGHEVKFEETINSTSDNVKIYGVTTNLTGDIYEPSFINGVNTYLTGYLYKKIVKDEDWTLSSGNNNTTDEYINKEGQTILVRKYIDGAKADTYYIYDMYGNLAFVLPPLASVNATVDQTILDNLCYQYKYDKRNRLVEKKLPGKDWEFMLYDKQDRLVATQDANLREKDQWLFTKYDILGRVLYTGITNGSKIRNTEQALVDAKGTNNEKRNSSTFSLSGLSTYYTYQYAYPTVSPNSTSQILLTVNYYDTYPYPITPPSSIQGMSVLPSYNNGIVVSPKGLVTGTYIKNIEDDTWTKNYSYYDIKNRPIGLYSYNHLGGYTKNESILDFVGIPQKTFTYHNRTGTTYGTVTIEETFTYDAQNRLKKHEHKVNNNPTETLALNTYNEIGQLVEKKVGGTTTGTELQTINYQYNVRGWLTQVNDPTNVTTMGTDLFGYRIRYNDRAGLETPNVNFPNMKVQPRYNGNIAEIDWNAVDATGVPPLDQPLRYGYVYDSMNRLQAGFYQDPYNPSKGTNNEIIEEYDLNGNIKKLKRFAWKPKSSTALKIDDLAYTYTGNSNKVTNIADNAVNASGYEGGNGLIEYDLNGNMTKMPDKGINSIVYNYLNLPKEIIQTNNTKYFYRADGVKIKKTFTLNNASGSTAINSEYLDGFQYTTNLNTTAIQALKQTDDNTLSATTASEEEAFREVDEEEIDNSIPENQQAMLLSFFSTAEGFFDYRKQKYIYQYKDNLGNVRSSYAKNKTTGVIEILDRNDYYPFGMNFYSYYGSAYDAKGTPFNYKLGTKELQETGFYDFGNRQYMSDLGRWTGVDPLAEKFPGWSPYNYAMNNPVIYIDPDGRETKSIHLDNKGNVLRNINDGDNSVFVHKKGTKGSDIDKKYTNSNHSAGGQKIGELGKTLNVNGIYTNLLTDNIKEAKGIYNPFPFKSLVTDGGDWDLKVQKNTIWGLANDGQTQFSFGGKLMESQDIGNHHFGAVALAALGYLLSEKEILMQAGDNQIGNGRSKPEWQPTKTIMRTEVLEHGIKVTRPEKIRLPPYGDDPRDYNWINSGFRYYKTH